MTVKNYAKVVINVFCSCPILLDFYFVSNILSKTIGWIKGWADHRVVYWLSAPEPHHIIPQIVHRRKKQYRNFSVVSQNIYN